MLMLMLTLLMLWMVPSGRCSRWFLSIERSKCEGVLSPRKGSHERDVIGRDEVIRQSDLITQLLLVWKLHDPLQPHPPCLIPSIPPTPAIIRRSCWCLCCHCWWRRRRCCCSFWRCCCCCCCCCCNCIVTGKQIGRAHV